MKFKIVVGSPGDYEQITVDITIDGSDIARLQKEQCKGWMILEFFEETALKKVYLNDFLKGIEAAKEVLLK